MKIKVLVDGQPAWIVGEWADFDDRGYDLLMADGTKRWINQSGARVRMQRDESETQTESPAGAGQGLLDR
jgi:hypothetical protein